jgi:hypothetical protein
MDPDKLIKAIEIQNEHYAKLLKLSEQQHEYVVQDRSDELLDVLTRRQSELDRILHLERLLKPIRADWQSIAAGFSPAHRSRIEALMQQGRELLGRITAADQDDAMVLQQRKLDVGRQLQFTRQGGQAQRRYAASAYGSPAAIDFAR